ncbi:MAG: TOBE domain-containing protein, partial [Ilumatobacteraceae bacterium]
LPVRCDGDRLVTELGDLTDPPVADRAVAAVAVVRPDDVTFEPAADGPAEVVGAEFRGPTWTYTLRLPSGIVVRSSRSHLVRVPVGATAHVSLVPGHRLVAVADDDGEG